MCTKNCAAKCAPGQPTSVGGPGRGRAGLQPLRDPPAGTQPPRPPSRSTDRTHRHPPRLLPRAAALPPPSQQAQGRPFPGSGCEAVGCTVTRAGLSLGVGSPPDVHGSRSSFRVSSPLCRLRFLVKKWQQVDGRGALAPGRAPRPGTLCHPGPVGHPEAP